MALLSQVIRSHVAFRSKKNSSSLKNYMFGTSKQMVVATPTCIQIIAKNIVPITSEVLESMFDCPSNDNHVGLSLSFGLVNVNFAAKPFILTSI